MVYNIDKLKIQLNHRDNKILPDDTWRNFELESLSPQMKSRGQHEGQIVCVFLLNTHEPKMLWLGVDLFAFHYDGHKFSLWCLRIQKLR